MRLTGFGHITIAYIATNLVAPSTKAYFQQLLGNQTEDCTWPRLAPAVFPP